MSEYEVLINRLADKVCEYLDANVLFIKASGLLEEEQYGYVVQLSIKDGECGFQVSYEDLKHIDTDYLALYIVNSIRQQMNP